MNRSEQAKWAGVNFRKEDGNDINGDGIKDLGALSQGVYYFEPKLGGFIKSSAYYGGQNAPAWRPSSPETADRITGFNGVPSYDPRDRDETGVGSSMYFHIGGASNTFSAGCQTVPGAQYHNFVNAIGGSDKNFYYLLINTR